MEVIEISQNMKSEHNRWCEKCSLEIPAGKEFNQILYTNYVSYYCNNCITTIKGKK
jgi:hypothetical protein